MKMYEHHGWQRKPDAHWRFDSVSGKALAAGKCVKNTGKNCELTPNGIGWREGEAPAEPVCHSMSNVSRGSAGASPSRIKIIGVKTSAVGLWPCRSLCLAAFVIVVAVMSTATAAQGTSGQSGPLDGSQIDRVGEQVMNGNEFRSVRRTVLEKLPENDVDKGFLGGALEWVGHKIGQLFEAIWNFFRWLFSGFSTSPGTTPPRTSTPSGDFDWAFGLGSLANAFVVVVIAVIVLLLVVIAAMIVKSIDAKKRNRDGLLSDSDDILSDVTTPPGELAASTYESRAIQFAATGNYRAAIRELLLGSMSWIERAGLIRYRKGLTNRDYLRSVWRRVDKRDGYLTTASQFEYVYFGRRTPTAEMFEKCLASFQGAFREEEAPTAAV